MRPRASGLPLAAYSAGHAFRFDRSGQSQVVDDRFSGAWFDPKHDGEGFVVEVLADDRAVVYWFTYHGDGRQRWMMGVGAVEDNRIVINDLMDSKGGRFGSDFNPAEVTLRPVGTLTITFDSCSQAVANYTVDEIGGHQLLGRLTEIHGHECGGNGHKPVTDISGSWYDPAHNGEGFAVQRISADQAVVFWFTYDDAGNQSWLLDTGALDGTRISFPNVVQPAGGVFGRSFNPASVVQRPWGGLTLDLDCQAGIAHYQSEREGYSDGFQALVPLTRLANSGCKD
jgi:hypothetical protein